MRHYTKVIKEVFFQNVVPFPGSLSQEKEPLSFLVFFLGSLNQETEPRLKFLVYLTDQ